MISEHTTVGLTLSSIVTVEVHVETLPLTSVTVNVTVLAPTLAHVNELGATAIEAIPQASEEPLSTSVATIIATPDASN